MNSITSLITGKSKSSFFARMKALFVSHPECSAWLLSLFTWTWLVVHSLNAPGNSTHPVHAIYCAPPGAVPLKGNSFYQDTAKTESIASGIVTAISNGFVPWIMMVVAMMFPLLNEPIRHVAFSVKRKDRQAGVLEFLLGYTLAWSALGMLFLLLPFFLDRIVADQTPLVSGLIKASGFLVAASLIWLPTRPVMMAKCSQTIPIRIRGWQLHADCLVYGLKMGLTCLNLCWALMAALLLAHHNLILMYIVTVGIIYERYLLSHTSKLPGYAWAVIALTLFSIEIWS